MRDCVVASFSDNHFGHPSNDPFEMLDHLEQLIFRDKLLDRIHILAFVGDFFDGLLSLDHPALSAIDYLIAKILRECGQRGVIVRVLEGTPSHDRGQSERWATLDGVLDCGVDFRYVKNLEIEYIEKYDANVLYVPDEWRPDPETTLAEIHELLKARGIEQVDLAFMHGMFHYQMPKLNKRHIPMHREEAYLAIVRVLILIGHIHTHSRHGIIAAQGSTDRLRHGEEEPKGFLVSDIRDNYANVFFVENLRARIYKTIQCYGLDIEQTLDLVADTVSPYPSNACVRLEAEPTHPLFANLSVVQRRWPTLKWTVLAKESKAAEKPVHTQTDAFDDWHPVHIDRSNIESILMDRIEKRVFEPDDLETIRSQLKELA